MAIKLSNEILNFSKNNTTLYEKFLDYINHYRAEAENAKGLIYDKSISFEQKDKEMTADILAVVEQWSGRKINNDVPAAVFSRDPQFKYYTFAVIGSLVDAVIPYTIIDSIGAYADIRYGGWGDSFVFNIEPRDLFAVSQAGHGKRTGFIQKQFNGSVSLSPINHKVTAQVSLYKVLAGVESLAKFTMKIIRSIETQMTYDAYDAMTTGLNALAGGVGTLNLPAYTSDGLVRLAQTITAWNGGNKATIVGTQLALNKVLPTNDANYRYFLDSDYVRIGYVREFNGFPVLALPQVADYSSSNYGLKLNDNELYVISTGADKLIKVAVEGETLTYVDDIDDNANLTQNATAQKSWAAGMATSALAGRITLG